MFEKRFQSILAGIGLMHLETVPAECHRDKPAHDRIVVNHQNVGRARHVLSKAIIVPEWRCNCSC